MRSKIGKEQDKAKYFELLDQIEKKQAQRAAMEAVGADARRQAAETATNDSRLMTNGEVAADVDETNVVEAVAVDNQGNPIDKDGRYILEDVAVGELTDEDFASPKRNVNLGKVSTELESILPINGRDVIIKKNVFEKNNKKHHELTNDESRKVIDLALNSTDLVLNDKPNNKPNYWILVNIGDKNALLNIDADASKPYVEVVGWRLVREKSLEQIKNRANRDGGQIIITQKGAAGLSALTTESVSAGKVTENNFLTLSLLCAIM